MIQDNKTKRIYESGEHCFHGEKYTRLGQLSKDSNRKKVLLEYGQLFQKPSLHTTPAIAKRMGGKKGLLLSQDELQLWNEISIGVQKEICTYKYDTYETVRSDLQKSGTKILIHPAMRCKQEELESRIWEGRAIFKDGRIIIIGKNTLGNLWMELRESRNPCSY